MSELAANPPDELLARILRARPLIALVGASPRPERPSHGVMDYLVEQGYAVIPVNPNHTSVLGRRCYPDLAAIPHRLGLVDVFRRPDATPDVARAAAHAGARTLWLQLGVVNQEAAAIARAAGLHVVMDRCLRVEHERLIGGPFPAAGAAGVTGVPAGAGTTGGSRPGAGAGGTGAGGPRAGVDPVGLCHDCRHAREVPASQAVYWLCQLSAGDPSFPRYPRLPVTECRGFAWREA